LTGKQVGVGTWQGHGKTIATSLTEVKRVVAWTTISSLGVLTAARQQIRLSQDALSKMGELLRQSGDAGDTFALAFSTISAGACWAFPRIDEGTDPELSRFIRRR
jgi:hypothetical protein